MKAGFRSSGDLAADRRYLWGEGAAADGDAAAAADLFRQAVEVAPDWATGWFAYGRAALAAGKTGAARDALVRCLALEPDDMLGAALLLARIDGTKAQMPAAYVAGLFDEYADRFEAHLTGALDYRGPRLLREALVAACAQRGREPRFGPTLDLGCGTGLMGAAITDMAGPIDGVDLSARMLAKASASGHYRRLVAADVVTATDDAATTYDLILAADVLVYLGDLAPLFTAVRSRLAPGGLFAFTAQRQEGTGYVLGTDLRFAHSAGYIGQASQACALNLVLLEPVSTRRDAGADVPGLVAVMTPS